MDEDAIRDAFASVGAVRIIRMFGGHSVSLDGRAFALAFDGLPGAGVMCLDGRHFGGVVPT